MTRGSNSRQTYLRLLGHVRPYWRIFLLAVLGMAATAATEPMLPALLKSLFDSGFGNAGSHPVWYFPALLIGIFLLRGVVGFVADYSMAWINNRLVADLRNLMFRNLVSLPTDFYDARSSGSLMSKLLYDVAGVTQAATTVLTIAVRDTVTVAGLLGWLLYLNWKLTLIAFAVGPLIGLVVRAFGGRLRRLTREAQDSMGRINDELSQAIRAHRVIKIFQGQEYEVARFDATNRLQRGLAMRQTVASAGQGPFVQLLAALALALIIGIALRQSAADQTTVGSFVGFITAMLMLLAPTKRLTDINAPLQRGLAAAESVFNFLDESIENEAGEPAPAVSSAHIRFEGVCLRYANATRDALIDIDLDIPAGSTVALVGGSGGGKTTLASLLPRFYLPTRGRILIDGVDAASLRLTDLRTHIALVSQDVQLFNDSVKANIAYGAMAGATDAAVRDAARAAHALEFIEALPQGFDTRIGENGNRLSGGQRQRLAIARALLKNAPILVLDEATSALDTESERAVQAALETLMQGRTTLVIAHRLSTIERADSIVVLDQGRIIEQGRHAELLELGGQYAKLWSLANSQSLSGQIPDAFD
ncbi:MAG: lipid A export permease/ATP-binding protein MsbA [Rhodocyclaceae bacterium]|nr:lipid A export permease/ATP-binding protein MsbA [Rhodocyclaceae bacterium]MBX3669570.1 lipid A export permease/ATP-binding protein MsbA [Rhodocyclaceae bacterium]